ncbi:MAG: alpha/beta fold hydrolase, partial [Planctomycetota bacterium]
MSTGEPSAPTVVHIPAPDGGAVAVKRRANPGGPPVIFLHGLAVNADLWNLPEVSGEVRGVAFHYRSLASLLHAAGWDVWLVNLRGHGAPRMYSAPPPGQTDWCVDHFILQDLPAVVDRVCRQTEQRPVIVGASMGAMTLAGYVQGARLTAAPALAAPQDGGKDRTARHNEIAAAATPPGDHNVQIVADASLARARQARLAGCVFVEFPAALRWPESLYDAAGRLKWRALLRDWWR